MQLKFVYKNNGKTYDIVEGANLSMSYNEDLSHGTIIIRSSDKIDVEPYDEIILIGLDFASKLYMLVDEYVENETRNRTGNKIYTYTIKIMSQVKLLENKILPSLSITPLKDDEIASYNGKVFERSFPSSITVGETFNVNLTGYVNSVTAVTLSSYDGTAAVVDVSDKFNHEILSRSEEISVLKLTCTSAFSDCQVLSIDAGLKRRKLKLTIKQYLERYNDLYGQKVRTETGFKNKFVFDVGTQFDYVCPELQFNNPTFRECITQLMMVRNCIPVVQNNVISYIDLSKKQNLLNKNDEHISYVETSQSSSDYLSEIRTNIKNVIQDDEYTIATEIIGFRSENSSVVNTNNLFLYTQHPIYEILSLKIQGVNKTTQGINHAWGYIVGDLVEDNLVYEKSKWETLDVKETLSDAEYLSYYKWQNSTVYYTRGSNVIENFGKTTKRDWTSISNSCIGLLGFYYLNKASVAHYPAFSDAPENWKGVAFSITYKTKADIVASLGKSNMQTTEREVVDNQNNNYINAYTFGLLEYSKANRLGNKLKKYYGRFPRNYANLPTIGNYYEGNEIIYKVDYQLYDKCVDVAIYTCPNYVLRNYFTSVQSKLRSWKIVDGNEAFKREDNLKWYLEFDYSEHKEKQNEITLSTQGFIEYAFGSIKDVKLSASLISEQTNDGDKYVMDVYKNVCGNSIIFTFGFNDNYEISRYISNLNFTSGMKQNMYSYVDGDGNFTNIKYQLLFHYTTRPDLPTHTIETTGLEFDQNYANITAYSTKQPKNIFTSYAYFFTIDKNLYKDNKEIPMINTQFEFCATDDILLGDEFIKGHKGNGIPRSKLKVRISDTKPEFDTLPSGTDIDIANVSVFVDSHDSTTAKLKVSNAQIDKYCYIYNTDNNKILLAFKGVIVWLNLLKQRNKNIYERDADNNLLIVNNI